MTIDVSRVAHELIRHQGRDALAQRFLFAGARAAAVADVLLAALLAGDSSVFGNRPGVEIERSDTSRRMRGFSPAPGFRFDVELTHRGEDGFAVRFSQPDRRVPYLRGDLLWTITDEADGAVLDEQINTERALQSLDAPLGGDRPSLRRWLFFRVGHRQVMLGATKNIAAILPTRRRSARWGTP
jgi:hypothetical protein